ncbi:hypothetical protein A1Q1_04581 [Trichosporon asahii var. asahii CBS 2479]|uniref:Translation initiation factor beta propellor-like domain-containing protein n=1 Tax=Trichosporon asahii var. asahii (strain ATCC 90039 / CBS 2479 / JCM 2466 / KCTC 7840 / NBRC 103889/ NCYC 2677 / UAMH 7654) TaxID=1186058 RepID=J4UKG8_TRIAS|nr:hypothetical protein A1Q1_04581 [Trichosporon asahii var. asahii CBS 2479]EJT52370.1 hypothetical protein A1Q1_04581 [Trichosporon asahii var. asahii CBS 2479]
MASAHPRSKVSWCRRRTLVRGLVQDPFAIVYSEDGKWIAYALANTVQIVSSSSGEAVTIEQPGVVALSFSPLASTLYTFERPVKSETDVYKNVKAWSIKGELIGGWAPVITPDEAHRFQPAGNDILIFSPPLAPRPATRLKNDGQIRGLFLSHPAELPEGCTSARSVRPYTEPAMAVWVGERKGAPANLALYPVSSLVGKPASADKTENREMPITVARKAFYKADKLNVKWNNAGTMALFLTHTDVDNTGKSYYGETNLYLVALDGSFDGLVDLDKEGPIYDFSWNPTSKDFCVCYGCEFCSPWSS